MSTKRDVWKEIRRTLTGVEIAKKVIAGVVLVIGVPASAIAQMNLASVISASATFVSETAYGCTVLALGGSSISQKQKGASGNTIDTSFIMFAPTDLGNCSSNTNQLPIAIGYANVGELTIDARLTNAVLRTTFVALSPDTFEPIGNMVIDLRFNGVTGQLSPYRTHNVIPFQGNSGLISQHERGYDRPAQASGTALFNGVDMLSNLFGTQPDATLTTRTYFNNYVPPRLLR